MWSTIWEIVKDGNKGLRMEEKNKFSKICYNK